MDEMEQMGTPEADGLLLQRDEIDTIGEILNISMGSAATAMSSLLDKQVVITPPEVTLQTLNRMDYSAMEPAIMVKIQYVEGLTGCNVMLFRQNDMQIILNLLMGTDDPPRDDFEFDEISMSAACEVMNQMMGASATALSQVLEKPINISTPEAHIVTDSPLSKYIDVDASEQVVSISFGLTITDVLNTNFVSVMTVDLARMIIQQVVGEQQRAIDGAATPAPAAPAPMPSAAPAPHTAPVPHIAVVTPAAVQPPAAAPPVSPAVPAAPRNAPYPAPPAAPAMNPPPMPQQGGYPQLPYGAAGMPGYGYPAAAYPPQQAAAAPGMYAEMGVIRQPVNVQNAQFPDFSVQPAYPGAGGNASLDLLMNVPLDVTVEIGKTKRKIKEIMEFGQGTVLELDKQAGAAVDIVVNGQMIARGDVVVIEDNFGIRITEILGMNDLMESLGDTRP